MLKSLSLTLLTILCLGSFAHAAVDEQQAIASAAQKLISLRVCNLQNSSIDEIKEEMESLGAEEYEQLKELANEMNHKALKKHLGKYELSKFFYITYEPEDCDTETLIIQVNRDNGQSKGLILFGEEDIKTRDL